MNLNLILNPILPIWSCWVKTIAFENIFRLSGKLLRVKDIFKIMSVHFYKLNWANYCQVYVNYLYLQSCKLFRDKRDFWKKFTVNFLGTRSNIDFRIRGRGYKVQSKFGRCTLFFRKFTAVPYKDQLSEFSKLCTL